MVHNIKSSCSNVVIHMKEIDFIIFKLFINIEFSWCCTPTPTGKSSL